MVEKLNLLGFSVHGMDIQGHGQSSKLEGHAVHFHRFEHLIDDQCMFIEHVKHEIRVKWKDQSIPVLLMGISFGGLIATQICEVTV